jgi:NAD(P)-dependent dehydrogenase (short-subunit alcohol dehydrogenase family)
MGELRFDGRVAIVTGAGRGLGRAYAHLLASKGAAVVVNDLGGGAFGEGASRASATQCVEEITANGGLAMVNFGDVSSEQDMQMMVDDTIGRFGRLDIVINNAGICRERSFEQMTRQEFDQMIRIHLVGAWQVTHAVWPHLVEREYGRVVMTSSAGMMGVGNMSHYGAAKGGVFSLMKALSIDGRAHGITVNALWPSAQTRLATAVASERETRSTIAGSDVDCPPDLVAPVVGWLAHEECAVTGELFHAGRGFVGKIFVSHGPGYDDPDLSMESARDNWAAIRSDAPATTISEYSDTCSILASGEKRI